MSDYAKKNVEHFDKKAASYDSPLKLVFAKKCTDTFLKVEGVNWDPNSTKVIDFACGTGSPPISHDLTEYRPHFVESVVVGEGDSRTRYE
jgi:ubiquinone/menaquinone biosynthesis C-methylase UbiE